MSHLPSSAVTLTGGCGCSCVRYTISIPPLSSRPILATDKSTNTPIRLPQFLTCHCDDCRRYTASFAPPYTVCPIDMLSLTLLPRDADADGTAVEIPASGALHPSEATRRTWLVHFQSPRKEQVHRTFCGRCGTSLFYVHDGGMPGYVPTLEILMASLDRECLEREYVRPDRHAWWKYGIPWVKEWQTTGKVDGRVLPIHDTTNITKTVES